MCTGSNLASNVMAYSFAYDLLDYEIMHGEAESVIYGKIIETDVLKTRYPLVKVEVLEVRKSNLDAKYVYFQSFKQIRGGLEYLEKERIILFAHEAVAQDGKLLIQPVTKNTGHTLGIVFKKEFDKYIASGGDDSNLKKISKLFNEFSAEEIKIINNGV